MQQRKGDTDKRFSIYWLILAGPGLRQEPGTSSGAPTGAAGTRVHGLFSAAYPGAFGRDLDQTWIS